MHARLPKKCRSGGRYSAVQDQSRHRMVQINPYAMEREVTILNRTITASIQVLKPRRKPGEDRLETILRARAFLRGLYQLLLLRYKRGNGNCKRRNPI